MTLDLKGYLEEIVRSENSGGYSDITFLNTQKDDEQNDIEDLYLISVKYYKDEKGIADYDVGKLCALINFHKKEIEIFIYIYL